METTSKINILIVGATGKLGSLVTKHCLTKPNLITNILVRDPQKNKDLTEQVERAGGRVIKGDITQPETIKGVTKGMHTVVCTVSGGGKALIEGEKALYDDCAENGVIRVVPALFGTNIGNFSKEELAKVSFLIESQEIWEHLSPKPVKKLHIDIGAFVEYLYQYFFANGFNYWGDANLRMQVTSYEDSAKFVAAAVARKDLEGHVVYVGHDVTVKEIAEAYNKVRGTSLGAKHMGSLEDMKKIAAASEAKGEFHAMFIWLMSYCFDERASFEETNNKDFPEVQASPIENVLKEKPELQVNEKSY